MAFIYDLLDTWNNAGTVFSGIKLNVTNTASAAGSKLIDLQIGGSTFFNVDKSGQVALLAGTAAAPTLIPTGDTNTGMWFPAADTIAWSTGGSEGMRLTSDGSLGIGGIPVLPQRFFARGSSGGVLATVFSAGTSGAFTDYGSFRSQVAGANAHWIDLIAYGSGLSYITSTAPFGMLVGTTASSAVLFITNNVERLRVNNLGNIGIGTSAPDALLSVNGIASFGDGAAATPSIANFGDLNTGMWFPAADTVAWSTGGSERMRVDASGRLLHGATASVSVRNTANSGTITPNMQLHATTQSSVFGIYNWSSTTTSTPYFTFAKSISGTVGTNGAITGSGTVMGGFQFAGDDGAKFVTGAAITCFVDGTPATDDMPGRIVFYTTPAGSGAVVERMRINRFGNIGIGTTAPDALLSVNGIASFGAGAAATPSLAAFGDTNTGMWFPAADTIAWSTGGSERLRITSGGNVGIGTSTFGTSAATVLGIATGTAPTTGPADTIQIYSTDLSAGNTMLSLYTEGTPVNANTTAAATHRIAIRVNGTVYYLLANTSST